MSMEGHGDLLMNCLRISYNDLSDVWSTVAPVFQSSLPLRDVSLSGRLGVKTSVNVIPVRVIPSAETSSFKEARRDPMVWFRLPFAEIVCFSCDDYEEYRRNFRLQLRAMVDSETRLGTDPEPIFLYVKPSHVEEDSRGPQRVFEAASRDLNDKNFVRVIKVDSNSPQWNQELMRCVKTCLSTSLETRASAYYSEANRVIRRIVQDSKPTNEVKFSDLYLLKDSVATMFESAGLLTDALTEYIEADAMIHETFNQVMGVNGRDHQNIFLSCDTPKEMGFPESSLLWYRREAGREIVSNHAVSYGESEEYLNLVVSSAIMSNRIRILCKLQKRHEAFLEVSRYIQQHEMILKTLENNESCPIGLAECWSFSASVSALSMISKPWVAEIHKVETRRFFSLDFEKQEVKMLQNVSADDMDGWHLDPQMSQDIQDVSVLRSFYNAVGEIALRARQSMISVGLRHQKWIQQYDPTVESILDALKNKTTSYGRTVQTTPKSIRNLPSEFRVTPQNSIDHDELESPALYRENGNHNGEENLETVDLNQSHSHKKDFKSDRTDRKVSLQTQISVKTKDEGSEEGSAASSPKTEIETPETSSVPASEVSSNIGSVIANPSLSLAHREVDVTKSSGYHIGLVQDAFEMTLKQSKSTASSVWNPENWRLKASMDNQKAFDSLWVTLTQIAQSCFLKGNRLRSSALLEIDIADNLSSRGDYQKASAIYKKACNTILDKNHSIVVIPCLIKLASVQAKIKDPGLIWTIFYLLEAVNDAKSAPSKYSSKDITKLLIDVFVRAAAVVDGLVTSWRERDQECTALDLSSLICIRPHGQRFKIFDRVTPHNFLQDTEEIECVQGFVGDYVEIQSELVSGLGVVFPIQDASITLIGMQELNDLVPSSIDDGWDILPKSPSQRELTPMPTSPQSTTFYQGSPREINTATIISRWQDVDELNGRASNVAQAVSDNVHVHQFGISPLRSGLYRIDHLDGMLHGVPIIIKSTQENRNSFEIVLYVRPPAPRLQVSPLSLGLDGIIAGERQWIGFKIVSGRDTMHEALLTISWPALKFHFHDAIIGQRSESYGSAQELEAMNAHTYAERTTLLPLLVTTAFQDLYSSKIEILRPISEGIGAGDPGSYTFQLPSACSNGGISWWMIDVGQHKSSLEEVRIAAPGMRVANGEASIEVLRESNHPKASISDVPVSFQYTGVCNRSISMTLQVPIHLPFQVRTSAYELQSGAFVVLFRFKSNTEREIQINKIDLKCQPGFVVEENVVEHLNVLPCTLGPYATFNAAFRVILKERVLKNNRAMAQAMVHRTGKLEPSIFLIEYQVHRKVDLLSSFALDSNVTQDGRHILTSFDDGDIARSGPTDGHLRQMIEEHKVLEESANGELLPDIPSRDSNIYDITERNDFQFVHPLALQLSSVNSDSYSNFVSIRMLGPFSVAIGSPVTLCWQLERVGMVDPAIIENQNSISFDIFVDQNNWNPGGKISGRIPLGHDSGSIATVELAVTPNSFGTVEAPKIRLHDVYYQEVYEVGANSNYILVKSNN